MLTLLRISGFALIDELELPLGPGLTAVTGETGAGKSILVDALGLLRGGRAGADVIRTGRDEARSRRSSSCRPARRRARVWWPTGARSKTGWSCAGPRAQGRGRAHLGGGLATAADLASTVAGLIDIASQHDQQSLTDPESQLAILDAFAENQPLRDEMTEASRRGCGGGGAGVVLRRRPGPQRARGFAAFSAAELEAAGPAPGEDARARAERERLRGGIILGGDRLRRGDAVRGDGAVAERLAGVSRELSPLAALDPALAPLVDRLADAQAAIEDVARDLGRYGRGIRRIPPGWRSRGAPLPASAALPQARRTAWWISAARQSALHADLAELGSFEDGMTARQAAVGGGRGARPGRRRGAVGCPAVPSGRHRPREARERRAG